MRITLRVITRAKRSLVELQADGNYVVHTNVPPVDGEANKSIIELLSEHFRKPKTSIKIVKGETSKIKVVDVPD